MVSTNTSTALATVITQMKDLDVANVNFRDDMNFVGELGFASIEVVTLIEKIKTEFGVAFGEDPDDLDALRQFGSLVRWIEDRSTPA